MQNERGTFMPDSASVLDDVGINEPDMPARRFMVQLRDWSILKISGEDCGDFLHAQLSSDVRSLKAGEMGISSWCNPKGRMLMNGYLIRGQDSYFLLLNMALKDSIIKNLSRYVLRSKVMIEAMDGAMMLIGVTCVSRAEALDILGDPLPEPARTLNRDGLIFARVRDSAERYLILGETVPALAYWNQCADQIRPASRVSWTLRDILNGLAWVDDRSSGEYLPLDFNLDFLGGLDFTKGCYPGQEIVTRIRHRGRVKKRLYLAKLAGSSPAHSGDALVVMDDPRHIGCIIATAPLQGDTHVILAVVECDLVPARNVKTEPGNLSLDFMSLPYPISSA